MAEIRWKARGFIDSNDFEKASQLRKVFDDKESKSSRRSCEADYYRWKILNNPFMSGILNIADDDGQAVGLTTITPKCIYLNGKIVNGAEIGDTFTHFNYQRQGIFTTLVDLTRKKAIKEGIEFIYGTPNNNSLPGYEKKCNFSQIPSVDVFHLVLPINSSRVLEKRFDSVFLARLAGPLVSRWLKLRYLRTISEVKNSAINISLTTSFPEDVYELWNKVKINYSWILVRNKQYLNWRFVENPDNYTIWRAQDNNKKTKGYMVAKIGIWKGLKVGYLADYLIDEELPIIFYNLVSRALTYLQNEKVDMVSCWSVIPGFYSNILKKYGFRKNVKKPIICYKNELGNEVVNNNWKWHFTMADSDNI